MCNAYELGKRGGSFPEAAKASAARELLSIGTTRLIRRTDPAPVVTASGELATMRWEFVGGSFALTQTIMRRIGPVHIP